MDKALSRADLENRFGFVSSPFGEEVPRAAKRSELREAFIDLADMVNNMLPDSREKSLALTELESASHWAQKALSRT